MSVGMTCTQIPTKKKVKYKCVGMTWTQIPTIKKVKYERGYDVYTNTDNKEC